MTRKIVLLSDGTGNSAAKITKTNIWRIYQAIDLQGDDQLAFYDDGVGTGGSKVLRYLGGGFGIGLTRNAREIYENLCRHYEGGDQIALFGFSRGAFTARVVSGLIENCGVIDRNASRTVGVWSWRRMGCVQVPVSTDAGLKAAVRVAYRSMRKHGRAPWLARIARGLRDIFLKTPDRDDFRQSYSVSPRPRIAFIGVFDTVSAYGLPVDEMTIAIHKYIFPLRFPNMILSRKVDHACQALALDEARHTFHPVLWTERTYDPSGSDGEPDTRPLQAWFPGMHSDVGGGYGDDRLSLVPALWMIEEAARKVGLRFNAAMISDLQARATKLGKMHDSRRGFGVFYRYKPRILDLLGNEDMDGNGYAEVRIDRFKIHESTLDRIRDTDADYAPLGIPADYDVVRRRVAGNGRVTHDIVPASKAGYETANARQQRAIAQDNMTGMIVWRRILYFAMIALVIFGAVVPLIWRPSPAAITDGPASALVGGIAWLLTFLPLPAMDRIGQFWTQHPVWFLGGLAAFIISHLISEHLARSLQSRAQAAWRHVAGTAVSVNTPQRQWVKTWRANTTWLHNAWTKNMLPLISVILLFAVIPALIIWRAVLFVPFDYGSVCSAVHEKAPALPATPEGAPVTFSATDPCFNTDFELQSGRNYRVSVTVETPWLDSTLPAGPTGLRWPEIPLKMRFLMATASPLRRFWTDGWFVTMGSIGRSRDYAFPLKLEPVAPGSNRYTATFHAWRSGRLYLFVNDAVNPFADSRLCPPGSGRPYWRCYYANNKGAARISLKETNER